MAIRIINPQARSEYILKSDRESDKPTIFVLRPLTWMEMSEYLRASPLPLDVVRAVLEIRQRAEAEEREVTAEENAKMEALAGRSDWDLFIKTQDQDRIAVGTGLVEVRGLIDQDGKPMQCAPEEFVRRATYEILGELREEIVRLSSLSEADRKN